MVPFVFSNLSILSLKAVINFFACFGFKIILDLTFAFDEPGITLTKSKTNSDAEWFYNGSKIERIKMVKLFSKLIKYEKGKYFVVTPSEKILVKVKKEIFLITDYKFEENLNDSEGSFTLTGRNIGSSDYVGETIE